MENKFVKFAWSFNGVVLFVAIIGFLVVSPFIILNEINKNKEFETGLIVGKKADTAQKLNINLQQLTLTSPNEIPGTDFYYVEVYVADKDLPQEVEEAIKAANDFSLDIIGARVNVIFFNSDHSYVKKLLPNNGFISTIDAGDRYYEKKNKQVRDFILYKIISTDSNSDGRINRKDQGRIFISEQNGSNLQQISPDSIDIEDYWVSTNNQDIFMEQVIVHPDRPLVKQGYFEKDRIYYYYNRKTKVFARFEELDKEFEEIKNIHKKNI